MAADEEGNLCRGPVGEVSSCRVIGRMGKGQHDNHSHS